MEPRSTATNVLDSSLTVLTIGADEVNPIEDEAEDDDAEDEEEDEVKDDDALETAPECTALTGKPSVVFLGMGDMPV